MSPSGAVHGRAEVGPRSDADGRLLGRVRRETVVLSGTVKDKTRYPRQDARGQARGQQGKLQVVFGECELEVGKPLPAAQAPSEEAS